MMVGKNFKALAHFHRLTEYIVQCKHCDKTLSSKHTSSNLTRRNYYFSLNLRSVLTGRSDISVVNGLYKGYLQVKFIIKFLTWMVFKKKFFFFILLFYIKLKTQEFGPHCKCFH